MNREVSQLRDLNVGELSVLRSHELLEGCWVPGHLHGLLHQLWVVEDVVQLWVALGREGERK